MIEVYDQDSHLDYQLDPFETIIRWICQVFLVGFFFLVGDYELWKNYAQLNFIHYRTSYINKYISCTALYSSSLLLTLHIFRHNLYFLIYTHISQLQPLLQDLFVYIND